MPSCYVLRKRIGRLLLRKRIGGLLREDCPCLGRGLQCSRVKKTKKTLLLINTPYERVVLNRQTRLKVPFAHSQRNPKELFYDGSLLISFKAIFLRHFEDWVQKSHWVVHACPCCSGFGVGVPELWHCQVSTNIRFREASKHLYSYCLFQKSCFKGNPY